MTENYPSIGYLTDPGQERTENQDNLVVRELDWGTLLLVADGMGGHQDGSLASKIAVDVITDILAEAHPDLSQPTAIQGILWEAIVQANQAIWSQATQEGGTSNMGTTVVLAMVIRGKAYVAHVGDSRLYHIGQGLPAQITMDHTTVQAMVDHGIITMAQSKIHPDANKLAKALGVRESVEPDVRAEPLFLESGDVLVLCSDGLYDVVNDDSIADIVSRSSSEVAARRLVQTANNAGGPDNISVIVYQHGKPRIRRSKTRALPTHRGRTYGLPSWAWILTGVLVLGLIGTGLALWAPWAEPDEGSAKSPPLQKEQPEKPQHPKRKRPASANLTEEPPTPANDNDVKSEPEPERPIVEPEPLQPHDGQKPGLRGGMKIEPEAVIDPNSLSGTDEAEPKVRKTTRRDGKSQTAYLAKDCRVTGTSDGASVVQFKNTAKNVDIYIERDGNGAKAYASYKTARKQLKHLPTKLKGPCGAYLEQKRVVLQKFYLNVARDLVARGNCKDARERAEFDARKKFGASWEQVKEALGDCYAIPATGDIRTEKGNSIPEDTENRSIETTNPLPSTPAGATATKEKEKISNSPGAPEGAGTGDEMKKTVPETETVEPGDDKGAQHDDPKKNNAKDVKEL